MPTVAGGRLVLGGGVDGVVEGTAEVLVVAPVGTAVGSPVSVGTVVGRVAVGRVGVLDESGATIARLTSRDAARLIRLGTANKGMVAKLNACRAALRRGVGDVIIADGRQVRYEALGAASAPLAGSTQVMR